MAVAERTVDHAERMNALWSRRDDSPFLSLAWHKIIESTAHDSVVGSGTDETSDQVEARLAEAAQTARAVRDAALAEPAALVPSDGYLVANPLPFPRTHWSRWKSWPRPREPSWSRPPPTARRIPCS